MTDEVGISQLPIAVQCRFASSVNWPAEGPDDIRTAVSLARAAYKNVSSNEEQVEGLDGGPDGRCQCWSLTIIARIRW